MKRQLFLVTAIMAVLFSWSCNKGQTSTQGRATVTMRDGTAVGGTVISTSSSEIKLAGDDHVTRTIPMSQVRSIDYEDTSSNAGANSANAPAAGTSPDQPSPAGNELAAAPATAQNSYSNSQNATGTAPGQPYQPNRNVAHESHEHPSESAITTKTFDLPVGTEISVRTEETIDSARAVEGQTFAAEVTQLVRDQAGATVIPRGANAQIIITSSSRGNRYTKASDLVLDLKSVAIEGRQYRLSTVDMRERGKSGLGANKRTAEYSGGGAALGAIIGAIAGGGKGAAIGAGAGGGAGAITQVVTKGGSIKVPVETVLTFKLDKPLHVVASR